MGGKRKIRLARRNQRDRPYPNGLNYRNELNGKGNIAHTPFAHSPGNQHWFNRVGYRR
jgi:hypothetical protein